MARLTWDNVRAPEMDLRGLAVAGQTITGGFDRLAEMLRDRETRLRTEATNAQAANILLADDEAGVAAAAQAAMGTGNRRVDTRAIAELASAQRNTVLSREGMRQDNVLKQESILDKQGANALAPLALKLHELQYAGKTDEYEAIVSELAAQDPLVARGVRQMADNLWTARTTGVTHREDNRSALASEANAREGNAIQRASVALRGQELSWQREQAAKREQDVASAQEASMSLAKQFAQVPNGDLPAYYRDTETYRGLTPGARILVDAQLGGLHKDVTTPTSITKGAFAEQIAGAEAANRAIESRIQVTRNQLNTPEAQAARKAVGNAGKIGAPAVEAKIDQEMPWWLPSLYHGGDDVLARVLKEVPGATPEDVDAVVDQFGLRHTFWGGDKQTIDRVQRIVALRKEQGLSENFDRDVEVATEGERARQTRINNRLDQMLRRAQGGKAPTAEELAEYRKLIQGK